jgi:hypothetical protein
VVSATKCAGRESVKDLGCPLLFVSAWEGAPANIACHKNAPTFRTNDFSENVTTSPANLH